MGGEGRGFTVYHCVMCLPLELVVEEGRSQADADLTAVLADPVACGALRAELARILSDSDRAEAVIETLLRDQITKLSLLPTGPQSPEGAVFHSSMSAVGEVSRCGHYFSKTCLGALRQPKVPGGRPMRALIMAHESELRKGCCGAVQYRVVVVEGQLGPADGLGFVVSGKLWRRKMQVKGGKIGVAAVQYLCFQETKAVFLSASGEVCKRNCADLIKVPGARLGAVGQGREIIMDVDLRELRSEIKNGIAHPLLLQSLSPRPR